MSFSNPQASMGYMHPQHQTMQYNPQIAMWFSAVDADRSGRITAQELQAALISSNGRRFSESACKMMIGMYDNTGLGSIDINGFTHIFGVVTQWIQAFQRFDRDNSGYIDRNELNQALATMGYRLSPHFADIVTQKLGEMGRGVPVDGFIMACIQIQKLTDGFRQKDVSSQGVITINYEDFLSTVFHAWIV